MTDMTVKAAVPWYGSKRTLAPLIVRQLGPHRCYWEPFCGSMAVLLAKDVATMETVNDLHGDLINLVRVVRDDKMGPALYRRLRRRLAAQQDLEDARALLQSSELSPLERAEAYFVNSWLSMNGTAGTGGGEDCRRGIARRFASGGGAPATRFAAAVDSIPAWRRRLRRVFVLNDDGLDLCERIEDKRGTAIYCDPPYLAKGESYVHDFSSSDHQRLAGALRRFQKTRVVVSYYEHPDLEALYPGWTKIDCSVTKAMVNGGRRAKGKAPIVKAPEVLIINGPSVEGQLFT